MRRKLFFIEEFHFINAERKQKITIKILKWRLFQRDPPMDAEIGGWEFEEKQEVSMASECLSQGIRSLQSEEW